MDHEEPLPVQLYSPDEVAFLAENNGREKDFSDIAASLDANGQTFPGMVCPHPDPDSPFKYLCLDGNRRLAWCKARNRPFMAVGLSRPVSRIEAMRIKHTSDLKKKLTLQQIADDAAMLLDSGMSQCDIARHLDRSEATISRALGLFLMPEEERRLLLGKGLAESSVALLAPLCGDLKDKAILFATTPGRDGRLPVRDALAGYIADAKKGIGRKAKRPKALRLKAHGREIVLPCQPGESGADLIEVLKDAIERLKASRDLPVEALSFVLG